MLEKLLIAHCAPTLAGIKTGNLFNVNFYALDQLMSELGVLALKLKVKGISLEVLRTSNSSALILAYRTACLSRDLGREEVKEFLAGYEYGEIDTESAISRLKERFADQACFPHEIGLFLGYPLEDVIGYIENGGQRSKCTGCWKVYRNEKEAFRLFDRYRKCRDIYRKMFAEGRSIMQLIVAA